MLTVICVLAARKDVKGTLLQCNISL